MIKNAKLNAKATVFEFVSYKFEPAKKRIFFNYRQEFEGGENVDFTETIILPKKINTNDLNKIPAGLLNKIFEGLHLILGISYFKFYCATKVKIPYDLTEKEANFWNIVYKKGLGEFFYRNKLDPKVSPNFPFVKLSSLREATATKQPKPENKDYFGFMKPHNDEAGGGSINNRCLVAVGGGKDSIVSIELLKEQNFDTTAFFVETNKESDLVNKIIDKTGLKSIKIKRILDKKAFQEHKYNGHIPVSAIYGFLGVLTSVLYKYSYFIVSNEYSSNFGNIKYKGTDVNHQWSKSSEFENLFYDYINNFITKDIHYFSLLKPFYEIRIAEMFSKYKKYFPYFSSCNKNFTLGKKQGGGLWCNECPKCVFSFILLSAFLPKKELLGIFKKNLYQEEKLLPLFRDILGFGKIKPFDCVGTLEEARAAMFLASKKFFARGGKNDLIIKTFLPKIKNPEKLVKNVFKTNPALNNSSQFRFFGIKNILILGYGKEGKVTKKYLKKYYSNLKIGIADANQGKNYLEKQENYDILIKTPGIKKDLITIPHTTATNIFFSKVLGKNIIVGITGSKGKSTTTSLIYEILKTARKNVKILGNIGKPMLEALMKPIKKDAIFVLELSSAQLEDLDFSPNIAVVTNLFPEHMDYHGNVENYYKAKKNIIKFQNKNNFFIYNPENKKLSDWAKESRAKIIPFANAGGFKSRLPGEHNKKNIGAAVAAARLFNISDRIIKRAVENFKPLEHRLEFVGKFKNIKFYDDAISTTPESTIMAIKTLKNIDTIFLGGQDRGYDFSQLEKIIKKYKIKNIVLFPDSGNKILKALRRGPGLAVFNILKTFSMEEAVRFAYKNTKSGGACLLSCASPSYSLWKNFEAKGNQFKKFVKKIGNEKTH
ncbi:MAG: UDP-N-acetylmuramoyl-L-alanine--D-glutamate ligase [Patescibacteria group bacterium]